MNISKLEQRVLHVLAQGGFIQYERSASGKITEITCFTREQHVLSDCTMDVFLRLKKRRLIRSTSGQPYRITYRGRVNVRAQPDNR